jgi:hypothetical protein
VNRERQREKGSQPVVAAAVLAMEKRETLFVFRIFHSLSRFFVLWILFQYYRIVNALPTTKPEFPKREMTIPPSTGAKSGFMNSSPVRGPSSSSKPAITIAAHFDCYESKRRPARNSAGSQNEGMH